MAPWLVDVPSATSAAVLSIDCHHPPATPRPARSHGSWETAVGGGGTKESILTSVVSTAQSQT